MNILFLLKSLDIGGLEIVTATLANKFIEENIMLLFFLSFKQRLRLKIDCVIKLQFILKKNIVVVMKT